MKDNNSNKPVKERWIQDYLSWCMGIVGINAMFVSSSKKKVKICQVILGNYKVILGNYTFRL